MTGDVAAKVTAAAQAALPGATIDRVENDAEGAVYEAHMTKAGGTHATVKFNADYSVAGIETGRRRAARRGEARFAPRTGPRRVSGSVLDDPHAPVRHSRLASEE